MPNRILLLSAITIFITASQTLAQTSLNLRWNQGERLKYVIEDDYPAKSTVESDFFELDQNLVLDSTWHVKNVSSKGVDIVVTIGRVRFTADGKGAAALGQKVEFDSKEMKDPSSKPERSVSIALKGFVDSPIAVTIDERGAVSKFELSEALAGVMNDGMTRELAGFFGDTFTEDGLRHRLTHWLVAFPKKPVTKGDTWQQEHPSRLGEPFSAVHTYSYAGPGSRAGQTVHEIHVRPALKVGLQEATAWPRKITEQDGEGVMYFDNQTGHIAEVVLEHRAVLKSYARTAFSTKTSVRLHAEKKSPCGDGDRTRFGQNIRNGKSLVAREASAHCIKARH